MSSNVKDIPIHTKRVIRSMSSLSKSDTSKQNDNLPRLNSDIKRLTIDKSSTSSQKPQPLSPSIASIPQLDSDLQERSTSGSSSNEITIFSPNQALDISRYPCYDVTKYHPTNPSWANFAAFHNHLISTPKADERLFSFLADLFSDHLFQAQTVMSLISEIEFLHQQQISLENNSMQQKERDIQFLKKEVIKNRDDTLVLKNRCIKLESELKEKNNELVMIRETYQTPSPEEMILGANARQPDVASISDLDPLFISQHHNSQRVSSPCHPTCPHQFRPQGQDPLEKFSGADSEKYAICRYVIDQKFEDDSFLFENNQKKIAYARAQLCGDLFIHMSNWKLTTPISD
ncbi:hypothetical protein HI914_02310 [Erysiphe necator]|nr:hypothetical protein HI914_02310 [Erysiphe necator]